jgi:LCP family protein required for cell wall assembly
MSRTTSALLCAALCFALAGCTGLAGGAVDETSSDEGGSGRAAARQQRREPAPTPAPTPEPTRAPLAVADLLGEDGRFTALLLGSDLRKGIVGERTDAIIVATIDPGSGKVAMVSLPRDTVNVPIAPGEAYADRINTLYFDLQSRTGKRKAALEQLREALAYAFDTEIDHVALIDFGGLVKLIDSIGGVEIMLEEPINDPSMHLGEKGLRLKAGRQRLDGKEALAYARSRHTDSDYDRSRRQQQVIAAAVEQARKQGVAALPALVELVRKKVISDIPMLAAPAMLELAVEADLDSARSVVLEPVRWARTVPGTYVISPRVIEIQKLFDRIFDEAG